MAIFCSCAAPSSTPSTRGGAPQTLEKLLDQLPSETHQHFPELGAFATIVFHRREHDDDVFTDVCVTLLQNNLVLPKSAATRVLSARGNSYAKNALFLRLLAEQLREEELFPSTSSSASGRYNAFVAGKAVLRLFQTRPPSDAAMFELRGALEEMILRRADSAAADSDSIDLEHLVASYVTDYPEVLLPFSDVALGANRALLFDQVTIGVSHRAEVLSEWVKQTLRGSGAPRDDRAGAELAPFLDDFLAFRLPYCRVCRKVNISTSFQDDGCVEWMHCAACCRGGGGPAGEEHGLSSSPTNPIDGVVQEPDAGSTTLNRYLSVATVPLLPVALILASAPHWRPDLLKTEHQILSGLAWKLFRDCCLAVATAAEESGAFGSAGKTKMMAGSGASSRSGSRSLLNGGGGGASSSSMSLAKPSAISCARLRVPACFVQSLLPGIPIYSLNEKIDFPYACALVRQKSATGLANPLNGVLQNDDGGKFGRFVEYCFLHAEVRLLFVQNLFTVCRKDRIILLFTIYVTECTWYCCLGARG